MNFITAVLLAGLCLALNACFENDHPPAGADGLAAQVKAPLDQAAAVNQMIDSQDAAQRQAIDEQGR
jgi:hypothetical protein